MTRRNLTDAPNEAAANPQLVVAIGRHHLRAALVSVDGTLLARNTALTLPQEPPAAILGRLEQLVEGVVRKAAVPASTPLTVVLPGRITVAQEAVVQVPDLGWHDLPLPALLTAQLQRPVVLWTAGEAMTCGEWQFGAGQGVDDLLMLHCADEIIGGSISQGTPVPGYDGVPGAIGHLAGAPNGPLCRCGARGCLTAQAGGNALAATASALLEAGLPSDLPDLQAERGERLSLPLLIYAAAYDDGVAQEVLARAGTAVGLALAALMQQYHPTLLVLGGELFRAGALVLEPLHDTLQHHLSPTEVAAVRIEPARLGDTAVLLGGAWLTRHGQQWT